jgi:hypothetical protein
LGANERKGETWKKAQEGEKESEKEEEKDWSPSGLKRQAFASSQVRMAEV